MIDLSPLPAEKDLFLIHHIPTPSPRVTQVTNLFYEKYCSLRTIDLSPFNHLNRKAGSERTFVSAYPYPQVQE